MKPIRVLVPSGALLLLVCATVRPAQGTQMTSTDLFQINGKVIARGSNTNPVGPYGLKTYRIEQLTLAPGTRIDVNGTTIEANTAWRVVIVGNAFPVRDMPPIVSIDETNLPPAQESTNLQELVAITFDRSLIRDNALLALSYGNERTEVPERVRLNAR